MPAAAAAISYIATSTAVGAIIARAAITMLASALISKLMAPKAAKTQIPGLMINNREPIAARRIIYGERRVGGVLAYMESELGGTRFDNVEEAVIPESPHMVSVPGTLVTVEGVYFTSESEEDVLMTLVGSAPGAGEYVQAGDDFSFSEADVGRNIAIHYVRVDGGQKDKALQMVLLYAGHEVDSLGTVYFNDREVPFDPETGKVSEGRYKSYARAYKHLGSDDQAADEWLVMESLGAFTAEHRFAGLAYMPFRLLAHSQKFPSGVPAITVVVRGRNDIYDPRSGLTGWSNNPALVTAHYLCDRKYGMGADYATEIDEEALIAAANICDELVTLADGSTEKRYVLDPVIEATTIHQATIEDMTASMAGMASYIGGSWVIRAGAYETPTVILDENDARGAISIMPSPPMRDSFNAVKGVFISPDEGQPTDYPPVHNTTYEVEDGERIYFDLALPFTRSPSMAQRIAKIALERNRNGLRVRFPCGLQALALRAGDTLMLNWSRFGWVEKVFEVEDWEFEIQDGDEDSGGVLAIVLLLKETAPEIYDWNAGEETAIDLTPQRPPTNPFAVPTPGILQPIEEMYESREALGLGCKVTLQVPLTSSDSYSYQFEYKLVSDRFFTSLPLVRDHQVVLWDIAAGTYDFRVRAFNDLGVPSLWSQTRYEVQSLAARPSDITGLTINAIGGSAVLRMPLHPDIDVRRGGRIHVRHSEAMSGALWEESYSILDPVAGDSTYIIAELKAGSYLLRPEDSSGNLSENHTAVSTKDATVLTYSTVASVTEDPAFTGAKSGVVLDTGVLKLSGGGMFDAIPDFDAVTNLDGFGGFLGVGQYTMTGIDLGSVKKVRLMTELAIQVIQSADLFDSRIELMDDWPDFDGPDGGSLGDCVIYVRETDDNPAGSPTWSDWQRLTSGEREARAFQAYAELTCTDSAYNVQVSKLRYRAEEVI